MWKRTCCKFVLSSYLSLLFGRKLMLMRVENEGNIYVVLTEEAVAICVGEGHRCHQYPFDGAVCRVSLGTVLHLNFVSSGQRNGMLSSMMET
jgi:hypothetical protein